MIVIESYEQTRFSDWTHPNTQIGHTRTASNSRKILVCFPSQEKRDT